MASALEFLDASFAWTLQTTAFASVVIILVLIIQAAIGKKLPARWRHALWLLVIARALAPTLPQSAWSIFNFAPTFESTATPQVESAMLPEARISYTYDTSRVQPAAVPVSGVSWQSSNAPINWPAVVWLSGCVIGLLFACTSAVILNIRIRRAQVVHDARTLEMLDACRQSLGLRAAPPVIVLPDLPGPALAGVWQPRVLMPVGLIESLDDHELRCVLMHELTHLARRDLVVEWLLVVMRAVHWFNPLIWYAVVRCRADREFACDERVLSTKAAAAGVSEYGHTILKLSQSLPLARPAAFVVGAVGILEGRSALKRRIHMIANFRTRPHRISTTTVAVSSLVVFAVCTLTDGQTPSESRRRTSEPATNVAPAPLKPATTSPRTMNMRVFRAGDRVAESAKAVKDLLAPSIAAGGEGASETSVTIDERTKSLLVVASTTDMERVAKLLGEEQSAGRQVLVRADFIAVNDAALAALKQEVPEAFADSGKAFPSTVAQKLVEAVRAQAKQDSASATVLSSPHLLVHEGVQGQVALGGEKPYVKTQVVTKGKDGEETYEPKFENALSGLALDVNATTNGDRATLDVRSTLRKVVAVRDKPFGKTAAGEPLSVQVPEMIGSEVTTSATLGKGESVLVRGLRGSPSWIALANNPDQAERHVLLLLRAEIVDQPNAASRETVTAPEPYRFGSPKPSAPAKP